MKLFASLRGKLPAGAKKAAEVRLAPGSDVGGLLAELGVAGEQAQVILINGDQLPVGPEEKLKVKLHDGDTVSIFPPLAGG